MKIIINHTSMQPIYEQITSQIKAMIIDNTLKEEEMLPSVRTLAKELKVKMAAASAPKAAAPLRQVPFGSAAKPKPAGSQDGDWESF